MMSKEFPQVETMHVLRKVVIEIASGTASVIHFRLILPALESFVKILEVKSKLNIDWLPGIILRFGMVMRKLILVSG